MSDESPCPTVNKVRADLARRAHFGLQKYGMTVSDNPLSHREWLQHAYEEALDLAVYLRRALEGERGGRAWRRAVIVSVRPSPTRPSIRKWRGAWTRKAWVAYSDMPSRPET